MEHTKTFFNISEEERPILERIGKLIMPIFEKVLQETDHNQVQVGIAAQDKYDFSIIRPHNYRRWFNFDTKTFNPPTHLSELKRRGIGYKTINHNSEHFFENYMLCNIRVKRKTIEIQNKIENDRAYAVDIYRAKQQMFQIMQKKEYEIIKVLQAFITEFGGQTTYTLIKHTEEIKIENNAITDTLAKELTWHTDNHKKVYQKKLVEIYDINKAVQLIDNSIFYNNVTEIAYPLKTLLQEVQQMGRNTSLQKDLSFKELSKMIKTVEDGRKYKESIAKLPLEDNWKLAKILKQRIFGSPMLDMKKRVFGG